MTAEEKQAQMEARDAEIIAFYNAGNKISQCASRFKMSRQRIIQILQKAGVWKPYTKNNSENFLGVLLSDETKAALKALAKERGVSMSSLSSEAIEEMLTTLGRREATT